VTIQVNIWICLIGRPTYFEDLSYDSREEHRLLVVVNFNALVSTRIRPVYSSLDRQAKRLTKENMEKNLLSQSLEKQCIELESQRNVGNKIREIQKNDKRMTASIKIDDKRYMRYG